MPDKHPVEGLMDTAMQSLKEMIDVNTILGDPVETIDGSLIIPVSRVFMGLLPAEASLASPIPRLNLPLAEGAVRGFP